MVQRTEGICKLCGKKKLLTYEHVPPQNAFNSYSVKEYSAETTLDMFTGKNNRMPWDFSGLPSMTNQRGEGGYYLCSECNNNTGAWYISEYVNLAKTFHNIIVQNNLKVGDLCSFHLNGIYPLRIIKAIMTMHCDINENCLGDERIREFLMNRESTDFNSEEYSVYIYMVSPNMRRISGLSYISYSNIGGVLLSEISSYPIGTILCIDKPDLFTPPGLLLSGFEKHGFSDRCEADVSGIPYLEINTLFPADFRSKECFLNLQE